MPNTVYNKVTINGTTYIDLSQDTVADASHIRNGYVGHLNDGEQETGTYSGGSPTLQAKTNISPTTSSQTIEPDSGYDGLSSVQINAMPAMTLPSTSSSTSSGTSKATITPTSSAQYLNIPTGYNATAQYYTIAAASGGASNFVTGTFKGTTTGAAMEVIIPYTGTGYPIGLIIAPDEGTYNSSTGSFYSLVQRYATAFYMAAKNRTEATPTYNASTYTDTFGVYCRYKNSTSNSTSYTGTSSNAQGLLTDGDAKGEALTCVRLSSKTRMTVYIASNSYGFAANITYRYYIIYSS